MKWRKRWKPGYFRLPGTSDVLVNVSADTVSLDTAIAEAEVWDDSQIIISVKSRETIEDFMSFDRALTEEFIRWYRDEEQSAQTAEDRETWVKKIKRWRLGDWQSGYTGHFSDFLGDDFSFTHFSMPDRMEGAIIEWESGDPEIWIGDFHNWISDQEHDPGEPDSFISWNRYFENGLVWALNELGLLGSPEELPDYIRKALPEILAEEQRKVEKILGQRYFWSESG